MRRGIPSLSAALSFAKNLRAERFHDPESVFVVDDATDEVVDGLGVVAHERTASENTSMGRSPRSAVRIRTVGEYRVVLPHLREEETVGEMRVVVIAPPVAQGPCDPCLAAAIADALFENDAALVEAVYRASLSCRHRGCREPSPPSLERRPSGS